jgi:regulatory protein
MGTPRIHRRTVRGGHDQPVPDTAADLTPDADPASVAREIALRQLTAAPRTRAQLSDAMARRGVPEDVAEAVLERFEEIHLIDDQEFARMWVESRRMGRGLARRALTYELRQRGVADDTVREAVDGIGDEDELSVARGLVRRRLPALARDDPARRTRRLAGMLARKGYSSGLAMAAIRAEVDAAGDEEFMVIEEPDD